MAKQLVHLISLITTVIVLSFEIVSGQYEWTPEGIKSRLKLPNLPTLTSFSRSKQIKQYFTDRHVQTMKYNPYIDLALRIVLPDDLKDRRLNYFREFMNSESAHKKIHKNKDALNPRHCGQLFKIAIKEAGKDIKINSKWFSAMNYLRDYIKDEIPRCHISGVTLDFAYIFVEAFDLTVINRTPNARQELADLINGMIKGKVDFRQYFRTFSFNHENVGNILMDFLQHIERSGDISLRNAARSLKRFVKLRGVSYIGYQMPVSSVFSRSLESSEESVEGKLYSASSESIEDSGEAPEYQNVCKYSQRSKSSEYLNERGFDVDSAESVDSEFRSISIESAEDISDAASEENDDVE